MGTNMPNLVLLRIWTDAVDTLTVDGVVVAPALMLMVAAADFWMFLWVTCARPVAEHDVTDWYEEGAAFWTGKVSVALI